MGSGRGQWFLQAAGFEKHMLEVQQTKRERERERERESKGIPAGNGMSKKAQRPGSLILCAGSLTTEASSIRSTPAHQRNV